jgi:hypothetical protein
MKFSITRFFGRPAPTPVKTGVKFLGPFEFLVTIGEDTPMKPGDTITVVVNPQDWLAEVLKDSKGGKAWHEKE